MEAKGARPPRHTHRGSSGRGRVLLKRFSLSPNFLTAPSSLQALSELSKLFFTPSNPSQRDGHEALDIHTSRGLECGKTIYTPAARMNDLYAWRSGTLTPENALTDHHAHILGKFFYWGPKK